MSDSRAFVVLLGAALLVASLFAPWFAVDFSGATRDAITQQVGQIPGGFGEFARGLLSVLPERIVVDGWQAFERTDIVLLGCALAAAFSALLGRIDVVSLAGGAAAVTIVIAMVDRPGPGGDLIKLQWGAWLGLAAAAAIVVAGRLAARSAPAVAAPAAPAGAMAPMGATPTAPAAAQTTVWPPA
jgi:hypothetical protein